MFNLAMFDPVSILLLHFKPEKADGEGMSILDGGF